MTWLGARRKELPPDWPARRRERLALDGFHCTAMISVEGWTRSSTGERVWSTDLKVRCARAATDVHHAVAAHDHRIESLRSLCSEHHKIETQAEAQQARGVGPLRLRPRAKHPGLR